MFGRASTSSAATPAATATPAPATPFDMSALADMDGGGDEEPVSDAAVDAVLKELAGLPPGATNAGGSDDALIAQLLGKPTPKSAAGAAPSRPTPRSSTGDKVDERLEEYLKASIAAGHLGRQQEAAHWQQRARLLVGAIDEILTAGFPPPDAVPKPVPPPLTPPATTPPAAAANATPSVSNAAAATSADEPQFDHVISLLVVDFEASRLAGDERALAALEKRRTTLATLEHRRSSGAADGAGAGVDGYAERLERAIEQEKTRSRDAKRDGDTREALNALRRAKIMMEELEDARGPNPVGLA